MARVLLLGATGYVGGTILCLLATNSDLKITCLVSSQEKAEIVSLQYPSTTCIVVGHSEVGRWEQEAKLSDIVIHAGETTVIGSIESLLSGAASAGKRVHYIHTSGTSILCGDDLQFGTYGTYSDKSVDDLDGVAVIRKLDPTYASRRKVEQVVEDMRSKHANLRTAIVYGPCIWGPGSGPCNRRSVQIPELARLAIEKGYTIKVGEGHARWGFVHVKDLVRLFVALVEKALSDPDSKDIWNDGGYYFTGVEEQEWGTIALRVAEAAVKQGIMGEVRIKNVSATEADEETWHGALLLGTNSRGHARRGKKFAGWNPVEEPVIASVANLLQEEKARMEKGVKKINLEQRGVVL